MSVRRWFRLFATLFAVAVPGVMFAGASIAKTVTVASTNMVEVAPLAALKVTQTSSERSVNPGDSFDWTITVTNSGQGNALHGSFFDDLPAGTTASNAPAGCTLVPQQFYCNLFTLAAGDSVSKTVTLTVADPLPASVLSSKKFINRAHIVAGNSNCPAVSTDPNCISWNTVEVSPVAALKVTQSSSRSSVAPGDSFDWTITATNNNEGDATNVAITDALPTGTSATDAPAGCALAGQNLGCALPALAAGDTFAATVTVTVADPLPAVVLASKALTNTAHVTADNSNCPADAETIDVDCVAVSAVEVTADVPAATEPPTTTTPELPTTSSTTTTATPTTTVVAPPTTTSAPPMRGPSLPVTGAKSGNLGVLAMVTLVVGFVLLVASMRRSAERPDR